MKNFILSWGFVFLSAFFDSYAAFVVKRRFNELGMIDFSSFDLFLRYVSVFIKSPLLLTAVFTFVAAPGLWFLALNRLDLSVGYPVLVGFHLLFVLFFGIFLLREALSASKVIGLIFLLASMYFLFRYES